MACPVCFTDTSHWVRLQCGGQSPNSYGLWLVPTNPSSIHLVGHMCCSPCVSKFTRAECHECRAPFDIRMSISRRLLLSRLLLTNLCPIPTGVGYVLKTYRSTRPDESLEEHQGCLRNESQGCNSPNYEQGRHKRVRNDCSYAQKVL